MNRSLAAGLSAAVLMAAFAAPAFAAKTTLEAYQEKGRQAYGYGDSCVEDEPDDGDLTCTWTNAWIFDGATRIDGERSRGLQLCVSLGESVFDSSEDRWEDESAYGCTTDANVAIAKNLLSAHGRGDVPTELESCWWDEQAEEGGCSDPVPGDDVAVDLEWAGEPPVSRGSSKERSRTGDCVSTGSSKGTSVFATVSGTIDGEAPDFYDASIQNGSYRYAFTCHQ